MQTLKNRFAAFSEEGQGAIMIGLLFCLIFVGPAATSAETSAGFVFGLSVCIAIVSALWQMCIVIIDQGEVRG